MLARATSECLAWRELLGDPPRIPSLAQFAERVPIVDRDDLFTRPWRTLIRGNDPRVIDGVLLSSGTSGSHRAVGLSDLRTRACDAARSWSALVELFGVDERATLLINTLPDGVAVELPGMCCVATGARAALGVELLGQLADGFAQTLLVGQPRELLELLAHAGRQRLASIARLRVISGGDFLDEPTRERMCEWLGIELDEQPLAAPLSSFGMAELGMHLLWETPATVALRRALALRPERLASVCRGAPRSLPCLMTYDPEHVHVEVVGGELVLTRLDLELLQPMIRYNSHDRGGTVDRERALACLDDRPELRAALPERLLWIDTSDRSSQ